MLELLLAHGGQMNRRDTFPNGGWTPFLGACHQACSPVHLSKSHNAMHACAGWSCQ